MAISINTQENPLVSDIGKAVTDTTIITSGFTTGTVRYEISRQDGQEDFTVHSDGDFAKSVKVVSVSATSLKIVLKGRQKYKVRVSQNGGDWSAWTTFKTRDKRYQTPDAITYLSDDSDSTANVKRNRTIRVTNSAKATTAKTSKGATVTNTTDFGYVGTTSLTETSKGATVVTDTFN